MSWLDLMRKTQWWRWSDGKRMWLTLELAIVLPAAALIGYSAWHLRLIQRDHAVEAAIQRDFIHVLKVAEKRMNNQAYKMAADVRAEFPGPSENIGEKVQQILDRHPEVAHILIYDCDKGVLTSSQPRRMNDRNFEEESEGLAKSYGWIKLEQATIVKKLSLMERNGEPPYYFFQASEGHGESQSYANGAVMTLPLWPQGRVGVGLVIFDSQFLRERFFPNILNNLMDEDMDTRATNQAVMMIHQKYSKEPLAFCAGWNGGAPEVERNLEGVFPGLTLAIKFKGTTIEALGHKFLMTSFLVVGGLSLLLACGIFLTYRNVSKAMALAKLKSDFVANVSHELRTPLSLIRLYAETLEMGRVTTAEKYEEYFRTIRKESERLTGLINNILDFSRIEAGKKEYSFRETNLAELVRSTLDSYRFQIEQNGFTLQEAIAEDVPPVRVDREAIARSLLNLINNAVKYSPNEKYLAVNLQRVDGWVQLDVVDHGIGIPRNEQAKIFEKFYRICDPLVHNTKGSGLGLALVRHIVEAHGGEIRLESAPGKGSKFTIALPVQSNSVAA